MLNNREHLCNRTNVVDGLDVSKVDQVVVKESHVAVQAWQKQPDMVEMVKDGVERQHQPFRRVCALHERDDDQLVRKDMQTGPNAITKLPSTRMQLIARRTARIG